MQSCSVSGGQLLIAKPNPVTLTAEHRIEIYSESAFIDWVISIASPDLQMLKLISKRRLAQLCSVEVNRR